MKKIVVIGAGSAMFAKKLIGDLMLFDDMQIDNISLVDLNTEKLEVMKQVAIQLCRQAGKEVTVEAASERREVLADADFVINTINVGGPGQYRKDLEIPDRYGLDQVIGDTIGPGGMFRFLRAYPQIYAICKDMEELCPDAYFFNYTNPMAPLCLALSRTTSIKIFGFCHNVQSTATQLADYLRIKDMSRISYWAAGINHMDWFLEFKVDGKDAYPALREISKTYEQIECLAQYEQDYKSYGVTLYDFVRFDVMRHFGYFVSESPLHLSEYLPYFRKNEEEIKRLRIDDRWWLAHEEAADEYFEELKGMLGRGAEIPMEKTFEYAPEIIHAYYTGKPFRANLNVKNTGLITNLPDDCVVEVPCYTDTEGIHTCYAGALPDALAALNLTNVNVHKLMADAVVTKDRKYIYEAVKLDPFTAAKLTLDQIHAMVDELMAANEEYITYMK